MANINIKKASVWVTTYKKYSSGITKGGWFYLADYEDKEAFENHCKRLHKDEERPEFLFSDFSDIPKSFIDESRISDNFWLILEATKDLNEQELEAFNIWANLKEYDLEYYIKKGYDIKDRFMDSWRGTYETMTDYVIEYMDETGYFDEIKDKNKRHEIREYFDHEKYGEMLLMSDYYDFDDKQVFLNLDRGSN